MHIDWKNDCEPARPLRERRGGAPEVMKSFSGIAQAALTAEALDTKTKELIALGISAAIRCDDCGRAGREPRRGARNSWHGDIHGRRPISDVCQLRDRSRVIELTGLAPSEGNVISL